MPADEIRPSRWYYALAGAVFVAGFLIFGIFLWRNLSSITEGLEQVIVPGKAELNLTPPGKYTIFYEHESVVGSRLYSTSRSISGLECALVAKPSGTPVALSRSRVRSNYSMGGRSGTSFLEFQIDQPGIYELSAQYAEGRAGPQVVLAVGQGFGVKILTTVFAGLGIVFGSLAAAVAIALVTAIRRNKARRQIESRYGHYPPHRPYPS